MYTYIYIYIMIYVHNMYLYIRPILCIYIYTHIMPFNSIIYIYIYTYIQGCNTHVANGNDCTVENSCGRKSSGTEGSIKQLSHSLGIFNHPCQLGHSLKKLTASAVDIPCNIYNQFWSMARLSMIYP